MASRWHILLERLGQRHRILLPVVKSCRRDIASSICPPNATVHHQFFSDLITPSKANESGGSKLVRDQVYQLTLLFGKLLKSGEDKKAAELLDGITSLQNPATVAVCNYLLNSCSKSRNPEMAKEVWSFMKSNGVQMNEVSYGCMLSALSRGGCLDEAMDLLHLLYKRKIANVVMYNTVLNGCMHAKSKMYAARCVQLMEAQGVSKDELSYIELIKLAGMRGDLNAARKRWKELTQNFVPSPSSRSPYIIALSRMNAFTEAYEEIRNMVFDLGLETGPTSFDDQEQVLHQATSEVSSEAGRVNIEGAEDLGGLQAKANEVSSKLNLPQQPPVEDFGLGVKNQETPLDEGHSISKKSSLEDPVFSTELPSLGPKLPKNASTSLINVQNAYNSLINAAGKAGDHKLAESLFTEMRQLGLKTDIYTYNALLRAVVVGRGVQHGLRIVRKMEESGLRPDVHSLTALVDGYCQKQQLNKAEDVLEYMESGGHSQKPTCYAFNILLKACAAVEDPERALRVFARMKEAGVAPDICTYVALFSACGNTQTGVDGSNQWSRHEVATRVTAIEMDMAQSRVPHTHESLTTVMSVLGAEGLTESMLHRLEDASDDGKSLLDATSFNTAILSCLNAKQVESGWDIYHRMKSLRVKPDIYTYNILINGCALDKDVSTAFELVDTMREEGIRPDVITFNSLLKVVCHSGEMNVVLDLLREMTAAEVQPDSATFNTILTSASYHKRLDVTEHVVEEMRRRKVLPDQHTLLPVVSIYMQLGQMENAVEALRVLSLRMLDGNNGEQSELKKTEQILKAEQIQGVLGDLARKNLNLREDTRALLQDALLRTSPESFAIYTAALAGLVHGDSEAVVDKQSSWEDRLSTQYDRRKTTKFAKSHSN